MKKSNELYAAPNAEVIEIQNVSILMVSITDDGGQGNQPGLIGEDDGK